MEFLMRLSLVVAVLSAAHGQNMYGQKVGTFVQVGSTAVGGEVFTAGDRMLWIRKVFLDEPTCRRVVFLVGRRDLSGETPNDAGKMARDKRNRVITLDNSDNARYTAKVSFDLETVAWLSIWCATTSTSIGEMYFGDDIVTPTPLVLPTQLRGAHGVDSTGVVIVDHQTIRIENLAYDGAGPGTWFISDTQRPVAYRPATTVKLTNQANTFNYETLPAYDGSNDVTIHMPDDASVFDTVWLSMYCLQVKFNFADVILLTPK
ncbi:PREDICTED: protein Skeletor, isoforms B/C-like isoform X2 [Priapulus caudatus]|uniref:Protein Skeletor, isoforms B/C-like isoform X2 n=1 Tax=Priapulus caudatus TaxID=37621 RepID=A0ABM1ETR4_PRICU|nr:PREDICTED: protein Skeletor, isoforms B/C-like isoform X2 [Priapulus caudatus]